MERADSAVWADEGTGRGCSTDCSGFGGLDTSPCQGEVRGFESRRPFRRPLHRRPLRRPLYFAEASHEPNPVQPERGHLPMSRSSFVGRERELQAVSGAIGPMRIVTLTGIGGCGKTRLALESKSENIRGAECSVMDREGQQK